MFSSDACRFENLLECLRNNRVSEAAAGSVRNENMAVTTVKLPSKFKDSGLEPQLQWHGWAPFDSS